MHFKNTALATLLACMALGASAQMASRAAQVLPAAAPSFSAEIGYGTLDYTALGTSAKPSIVRATFGYEAHENLAFEAMLATDGASGTVTGTSTPAQLKVERMVGFYLKPKAKIATNLEVFGRVGYMSQRMSLTSSSTSSTQTDWTESSYGAGLRYALWPRTTINVDYMSYYAKDDAKLKGFNVGIGFLF